MDDDLRRRAAKAMAESVGSQAFKQIGPAWEGFRGGWLGYADAALSVVRPLLERLRSRVAELEAHRAADRADAALDRVFTLAQTLKAEAERGEQSAVIDSQRAAWRSSAHTAALFLAALDDPEDGRG